MLPVLASISFFPPLLIHLLCPLSPLLDEATVRRSTTIKRFSGLDCLEGDIAEDVAPSTAIKGNVSSPLSSLLSPFADALNKLNSA